jgi:hypothetical protein
MFQHVMTEHIYPAMEAVHHCREDPQELLVLFHYILIKSPNAHSKYADFLTAYRDVLPDSETVKTMASPRHHYPELYNIARRLSQVALHGRKKRWGCQCGAKFRTSERLQKHIVDEKGEDPLRCHFQIRPRALDNQRNGHHSARM